MCKFIRKSNERILCKLSKNEILRLYTIVHVVIETTKTSHFTCQSKSSISTFFTCQVSAFELQPFSCHDLANDIYSITDKTVFSHLNAQFFPCTLEQSQMTARKLNRLSFFFVFKVTNVSGLWLLIDRKTHETTTTVKHLFLFVLPFLCRFTSATTYKRHEHRATNFPVSLLNLVAALLHVQFSIR